MQFLDLAGVKTLWDAIKRETAKSKTTVEGESAHPTNAYVSVDGAAVTGEGSDGHTNYVVTLHNAASTTYVDDAISALKGDASATGDTLGELEDRVESLETGASVTITEVSTELDAGVLKAYNFTQNGTSIGTVNIPKDFLVKSGSVRTIGAGEATQDMPVGTKVLDFVVNTVEGDETATHIIIPVSDLVDVYTGGNGIAVSNANVISAVVDSTNDEGYLTSGANGLYVSGVDQAISDAVDAAKDELIGESTDAASADTINGAKAYADSIVAAKNVTATGDSYVSASASNNAVTVAATQTTKDSLALADSALQGVDSTPAGTNVQVTLGKSGKNVTVSVVETGLTDALAEKADKVNSATAGNFAGLDANGNLTDSGFKAADFATAAQGAKADTAVQTVTGETAVANSNYVAVSVEAVKTGTDVALTSHANVTTHTVSDAVVGTADGLATAADVKSYVDGQKTAVDTVIANMDADLDASGTPAHGGVFVMNGVTQVDGVITSVDPVEVEAAGAAAAAKTELLGDATANGNTLGKLEDRLESLEGSGSGSIDQRITNKINELDSSVNGSQTTNVTSVDANNSGTTTTHVTPAHVLTSVTIVDGKFNAAASELLEGIPDATLNTIFV